MYCCFDTWQEILSPLPGPTSFLRFLLLLLLLLFLLLLLLLPLLLNG